MENKEIDTNTGSHAPDDASPESGARPTRIIIFVVLLLTIISLNGLFYWLWLQQKLMVDNVVEQDIQQNRQLATIDSLTAQLDAKNKAVEQQLTTIDRQYQSLTDKIQTLNEYQSLTRGDVERYWALSEIEMLLNLANQRLLLASDITGAHAALELADGRVQALADHRLYPLRALLAQELLSLTAIAQPDIEGMALDIQSALNNVDRLHVLMAPPIENDGNSMDSSDKGPWKNVLDRAWQEIKSLIIIRHQQDAELAVLIPEQRYFLIQNLILKLETAQLSLFRRNESVFHAHLNSAATWLERYFIGNDRDAMLTLINNLKVKKIAVVRPDISGSLQWLKEFEQ